MTKEDAIKKQLTLIVDLVSKQSVAKNWVENMTTQWRIDAVKENIQEIKDTPPGGRISLVSFVD